jgi:hypothetical protein
MENIKQFYTEEYPTDDLGYEINTQATFEGLFNKLDRYKDIYEYIGVSDSLVRERIFARLSEVMGVNYDYIYSQWALSF